MKKKINFRFDFYVKSFKKMLTAFKSIVLMGPVTKIKNIKTDATKILRPTHFGE